MLCLGIDTSNYTTSAAVYDTDGFIVSEKRRLLTVKPGEAGLRQADAVFQHTAALPSILEETLENCGRPDCVAVSVTPDETPGSYMPCFLAGKSAASAIASAMKIPLVCLSHQAGHIAAAAFSSGNPDLLKEEFIAFHVSGGTTQALLVSPDGEKIISAKKIAGSLDLKAGQAIDRTGILLGLSFPAGPELDRLAQKSCAQFRHRPFMRDGYCSLSGIQNKTEQMKKSGAPDEDIAKYCITYIAEALSLMTKDLLGAYPGKKLLYSGGVMSNTYIRKKFTEEFGACFAGEGYSSDNAAGISILGGLICR